MAPLRICLVSAELAPFAKTGGLADVSGAIASFLARNGHSVLPVMPLYRRVAEGKWPLRPVEGLGDLQVDLGARRIPFSVETAALPDGGPDVLFLRCPELYDRPGIYTSDGDEHVRFAFLSRACLAVCQWLGWSPDVVHCNDWHTGLTPLYLEAGYGWDKLFERTRTVLTIHNIGYQGVFPADVADGIGLGDHMSLLHQEDLGQGRIGFLKTGLLYADALTTVSETYAREIQTAEQGMGLQDLLQARSDALTGIVNGVDYSVWNPETDPHVPHRYSASDLAGKERCKAALLEEFGLPTEPDAPLLGIVSRLTAQKGFELLPDILPVLLKGDDLRLVVLGSGEPKHEEYFQWLRDAFPTKVGVYRGYDEPLAHFIEAASDAFLMPSRYEPCGLNQMYSLRYGTVPIVRRTGGLADTVQPYDPRSDTGTGFVFEEFAPEALYRAVRACLATWRDRPAWKRLVLRGMAQDFSWDRQGRHYVRLYERLRGG